LFLEFLEERWLLSSAGDLDPSFGMGGQVTSHFSSGSALVARVLVAPDGRIVVAGSVMDSPTGISGSFALPR